MPLKYLLIFSCGFFVVLGFSQRELELNVYQQSFNLNTWYKLSKGDSIRINLLKFYLGGGHQYYLVDAEDTSSFALPFSGDSLIIGMDSLSNTAGILTGPYDPLLGMYWAWNTGYIQLKVSGEFTNDLTIKTFEYHIGGYRHPYLTCQTVISNFGKVQHVQLERLFESLPLSQAPRIMLPGAEALAIHKAFVLCFE
jgi:hypothetical protein